jgi:peptide/nickel transport system substrate-binding protein
LEELGWLDADSDPATPRVAQGVSGVPDGRTLRVTFAVSDDPAQQSLAQRLQADAAACGIGIVFETQAAEELFAPWPDGPAWGGEFEAVLWAWPVDIAPGCEVYAGWEIAGDQHPEGINTGGWSSPAFDAACVQIALSLKEDPVHAQAALTTQRIFLDELPGVALLVLPRGIAHRPDVCGLQADPTVRSSLWGLEAAKGGPECLGEGG